MDRVGGCLMASLLLVWSCPRVCRGKCLPVWVRPVQCSTIWALVPSSPSTAGGSLNGGAKCLGTWVSIVSKGQFVCPNDKVLGIWWLSPIETYFTAWRPRSLKLRCSWDPSPHPQDPGRTSPCLFQPSWLPCIPLLWLHLSLG